MKESIIISKVADCFIELIHRDSNPTVWIVRRWKENLWLKKLISSDWFIDGKEALSFAERMKRDHDRNFGSYPAKDVGLLTSSLRSNDSSTDRLPDGIEKGNKSLVIQSAPDIETADLERAKTQTLRGRA